MKNLFKPFLLFFFIICVSLGCKKEKQDHLIKGTIAKAGPIPSYNFNWETATYMPSVPSNSIPMPWNSGTTAINPDIVSDFKSVDGWSLVYNTFTPTTPTSGSSTPYFFALYNKLRGLLRVYLYQPPTTTFSSYIQHGLNVYSSNPNSSMLNFANSEVSDLAVNVQNFSKIDNQQISANGGTWIAVQYEMAYDPSVAQSSFSNLGLGLNAQYVNVSQIQLDGSQVGTINSTVGSGGGGFNLSGTATNVLKGAITAYGLQTINNAANDNPKSPILKTATSAVSSLLSGNITGVLNAVIGAVFGGGNAAPQVNLTINSKISLSGTSISNGGLTNIKLAIPGQSNSQTADGITPIYNEVMGVFNITSKPTVQCTNKLGLLGPTVHQNIVPNIDMSAVNLIINPSVSAVAQITNIKKDLIFLEEPEWYNSSLTTGTIEKFGEFKGVVNPSRIGIINKTYAPGENQNNFPQYKYSITDRFVIRISFDIVPNSGAPKVTIVKTFLANIAETN